MGNYMWEAGEFIYDAEESITTSTDRGTGLTFSESLYPKDKAISVSLDNGGGFCIYTPNMLSDSWSSPDEVPSFVLEIVDQYRNWNGTVSEDPIQFNDRNWIYSPLPITTPIDLDGGLAPFHDYFLGKSGGWLLHNKRGEVYMATPMFKGTLEEIPEGTPGLTICEKMDFLGMLEEGYTVKAAGDFSGSGLSGVLLQTPAFGDSSESQNYGLSVWARDNDGTVFTGWLGALVNTWQEGDALQGDLNDSADINAKNSKYDIVGIADFNGDGIDDVIIRNTMPGSVDGHAVTGSGDVFVFLTGDRTALINGDAAPAAYTGKITGDWEIVGFGDFNGDGTADILFTDGNSLAGWQISNGQRTADLWFGDLEKGKTFDRISDVNGDGTDDIVFYSGTADTYKRTAWTIQDGAVTGIIALS